MKREENETRYCIYVKDYQFIVLINIGFLVKVLDFKSFYVTAVGTDLPGSLGSSFALT
jgi:hypothetical protein